MRFWPKKAKKSHRLLLGGKKTPKMGPKFNFLGVPIHKNWGPETVASALAGGYTPLSGVIFNSDTPNTYKSGKSGPSKKGGSKKIYKEGVRNFFSGGVVF